MSTNTDVNIEPFLMFLALAMLVLALIAVALFLRLFQKGDPIARSDAKAMAGKTLTIRLKAPPAIVNARRQTVVDFEHPDLGELRDGEVVGSFSCLVTDKHPIWEHVINPSLSTIKLSFVKLPPGGADPNDVMSYLGYATHTLKPKRYCHQIYDRNRGEVH